MTPPIAMTRSQVREVDRLSIEKYGVPGIVLMETAGRNAAEFLLRRIGTKAPTAIVCGRGNNGGDGFVIARHLAEAGTAVEVLLACDPARLAGDAAISFDRLGLTATRLHPFDSAECIEAAKPVLLAASVVVDAVLGTGFVGDARPPLDLVIEAINAAKQATIVAIDVPSGLDADTGSPSNATVRATITLTFVSRKIGFDAPGAAAYTGEVHVLEIGAPAQAIQEALASGGSH